jgi:membrane associated rhomboid family serine protease
VAPVLVPYKVDVPMARVPVANWVLIGVTCLVSIVVFLLPSVPSEPPPLSLRWDPLLPVWLFTYLFVHGDLFHLLGNMAFLFVFGNAVNAKVGHWQFLVSYLLLGALAGLAFLPFSGGLPILGASGAIMGIVGVFVVLFPRNDVEFFYWFGLVWAGVARVAAYWVVLFYVVCDMAGVVFDNSGPVAYLAHVVGAAAGFGLGIALVQARVVRSTRYEENLLEMLGYQRKRPERRKKARRAVRPSKDRRTVAQLLAGGSDFDICDGVFRRVKRQCGGAVNVVGLGTEERVVVLVWHSLRVVEDGGFRALFEERVLGDRRWARTVEAYDTIGCTRAANALRRAADHLSGADTGEYADERLERSLRALTGMPASEERRFLEVIDEVEPRLAEYVRAHREFSLTLDE